MIPKDSNGHFMLPNVDADGIRKFTENFREQINQGTQSHQLIKKVDDDYKAHEQAFLHLRRSRELGADVATTNDYLFKNIKGLRDFGNVILESTTNLMKRILFKVAPETFYKKYRQVVDDKIYSLIREHFQNQKINLEKESNEVGEIIVFQNMKEDEEPEVRRKIEDVPEIYGENETAETAKEDVEESEEVIDLELENQEYY